MSDHVILLHGLWMRGFSLLPLGRRLQTAGFEVSNFEYASVVRGPETAVERLIVRARAMQAKRLHLVGHSLGGIVSLLALQAAPDLPAGRVVCLGSPLKGSAAARGFARFPGGRVLIGRSLDLLSEGVQSWNGSRPVGVIAGRLPIGFGFVLGPLTSPNDGTVSVEETQLPGISDHRTVAATHTGLLFSDEAAELTVAFLRDGRFPPPR